MSLFTNQIPLSNNAALCTSLLIVIGANNSQKDLLSFVARNNNLGTSLIFADSFDTINLDEAINITYGIGSIAALICGYTPNDNRQLDGMVNMIDTVFKAPGVGLRPVSFFMIPNTGRVFTPKDASDISAHCTATSAGNAWITQKYAFCLNDCNPDTVISALHAAVWFPNQSITDTCGIRMVPEVTHYRYESDDIEQTEFQKFIGESRFDIPSRDRTALLQLLRITLNGNKVIDGENVARLNRSARRVGFVPARSVRHQRIYDVITGRYKNCPSQLINAQGEPDYNHLFDFTLFMSLWLSYNAVKDQIAQRRSQIFNELVSRLTGDNAAMSLDDYISAFRDYKIDLKNELKNINSRYVSLIGSEAPNDFEKVFDEVISSYIALIQYEESAKLISELEKFFLEDENTKALIRDMNTVFEFAAPNSTRTKDKFSINTVDASFSQKVRMLADIVRAYNGEFLDLQSNTVFARMVKTYVDGLITMTNNGIPGTTYYLPMGTFAPPNHRVVYTLQRTRGKIICH